MHFVKRKSSITEDKMILIKMVFLASEKKEFEEGTGGGVRKELGCRDASASNNNLFNSKI